MSLAVVAGLMFFAKNHLMSKHDNRCVHCAMLEQLRCEYYCNLGTRRRVKPMIGSLCLSDIMCKPTHTWSASLLHTSKCATIHFIWAEECPFWNSLCLQAILYVAWEFRNHHSSSSLLLYTRTHARTLLSEISSSVDREYQCVLCVCVCAWEEKSKRQLKWKSRTNVKN